MDQKIFLVIFLSFTAGYIFRTIVSSYRAFMEMADFIEQRADECLMLIAEATYKISFVDELCCKIFKDVDPEQAKILRNSLNENFQEWKISTMNAFLEAYPDSYKWQLEKKDWDEVLSRIDDIYEQEKFYDEKKS